MSLYSAIAVARKYANGGAVESNPPMKIKKHVNFQGLQISIETRKGEIRRGIDREGKPWANRMAVDYGYIKRTEGKDGDQVDVFVGPNRKSDRVFIIDQLHHHMEKFDEHKCLVGFGTKKQALTAYHRSYGRKYGAHHTVGAVTELSMDAFKEWLKGGGGKKPVAPDVPKYQHGGVVFDPDYVNKYKVDMAPDSQDDDTILDAPGVGPAPALIPEAVSKTARGIGEWISTPHEQMADDIPKMPERGEWSDEQEALRQLGQAQKAQKGIEFGGQTAMATYGTSAGLWTPARMGVASIPMETAIKEIAQAEPSKVQYLSQVIADKLSRHTDVDSIQSSLNNIRAATSDRAAVAVFAKLPEDVQYELTMRELSRGEGGFGRAEQAQVTQPQFREITHPAEARDWLRERGHSPEDMGFSDPESYVIKANELKRREAGLFQPATEEQVATRTTSSQATEPKPAMTEAQLDEMFGTMSPSQVEHLTSGDLESIRNGLSMAAHPADYEAANPKLWNAIHQKIDAMDGRFSALESPRPTYRDQFNKYLAPHYGSEEEFYKDFFGGLADRVESSYDPWGGGFVFRTMLKNDKGEVIGRSTRSFDPETKTAYHGRLQIDKDSRGTGAVPTMLSNQINIYKKLGINTVELTANIDVGGYAWAKYGWIPDQHDWNYLRRMALAEVNSSSFKMSNNAHRNALIEILENKDPRSMWVLADSKAVEDVAKVMKNGEKMPFGQRFLASLERNWHGTLDLNNEEQMARFFEYVASKAKGKQP